MMKSFFNFDIEWSYILTNFLAGIAQLTTFVTFDFVQLPGLGCLTKMPYDTKVLVMTILPFLIGLTMWTPVLVLWCQFRWSKSRSETAGTDSTHSAHGRGITSLALTANNNLQIYYIITPLQETTNAFREKPSTGTEIVVST